MFDVAYSSIGHLNFVDQARSNLPAGFVIPMSVGYLYTGVGLGCGHLIVAASIEMINHGLCLESGRYPVGDGLRVSFCNRERRYDDLLDFHREKPCSKHRAFARRPLELPLTPSACSLNS